MSLTPFVVSFVLVVGGLIVGVALCRCGVVI